MGPRRASRRWEIVSHLQPTAARAVASCGVGTFFHQPGCADGKKIIKSHLLDNRLSHLMPSLFAFFSAVQKVRWWRRRRSRESIDLDRS